MADPPIGGGFPILGVWIEYHEKIVHDVALQQSRNQGYVRMVWRPSAKEIVGPFHWEARHLLVDVGYRDCWISQRPIKWEDYFGASPAYDPEESFINIERSNTSMPLHLERSRWWLVHGNNSGPVDPETDRAIFYFWHEPLSSRPVR